MNAPTIIQAADDPLIWKSQFADRDTWTNWFTVVKALFGLPLDASELELFKECTGRDTPSPNAAKEGWLIVGRRGGKSRIMAFLASYAALFMHLEDCLDPGEIGVISVVAADREQCRWIMGYLRAFIVEHPTLSHYVTKRPAPTDERITLTNGLVIEVVTCSYKAVRGRTIVMALCDEAAFWSSEDGSNPASEVIRAIRPAMLTVKRAMLIVASSPYARSGPLFDAYKKYWGKDHKTILCWKAPTWVMNMSPDAAEDGEYIRQQYEDDPVSAKSEYGAEWRDSSATAFLNPDVVTKAVITGVHEIKPSTSFNYVGFSDAAGGAGGDSFTAAVCHRTHTGHLILDAIREIVPPFSPESAIAECTRMFKSYGVRSITADRYAAQFPVEIYAKYGINCLHSELSKSDIYCEFLPLINSGLVELLDNQKLVKQLVGLERRTSRGAGRDSVDHAKNAHDDVANAVAGAIVVANAYRPLVITQEMLAASRQPPNRSIISFGRKPPCYF